jgi:hypothetical protein
MKINLTSIASSRSYFSRAFSCSSPHRVGDEEDSRVRTAV